MSRRISEAETSTAAHPESGGKGSEQRREPRRAAAGSVLVRFGHPQQVVRGRLVDISDSGFRIAHDCTTLETGQTVEFSHPEARGKAKVVWNRIAGTGVETGFFLLNA